MRIKPYTFLKLKDGDYFLCVSVAKRRIELGTLPDKIVRGYKLPENIISFTSKTTSKILNPKTVSFQELDNFIYNNGLKSNYWESIEDVDAIIDRKDFDFDIGTLDKI